MTKIIKHVTFSEEPLGPAPSSHAEKKAPLKSALKGSASTAGGRAFKDETHLSEHRQKFENMSSVFRGFQENLNQHGKNYKPHEVERTEATLKTLVKLYNSFEDQGLSPDEHSILSDQVDTIRKSILELKAHQGDIGDTQHDAERLKAIRKATTALVLATSKIISTETRKAIKTPLRELYSENDGDSVISNSGMVFTLIMTELEKKKVVSGKQSPQGVEMVWDPNYPAVRAAYDNILRTHTQS